VPSRRLHKKGQFDGLTIPWLFETRVRHIRFPLQVPTAWQNENAADIREVERDEIKQVEAVRATGAPFMSVIAFGVLPQVFTRFIGFCTYQLDSNLRNSTMVGIVGAGGIGGTLFAAFQRFDYDYVCAILISIIALIMIGEVLATYVRAIFIDGVSFADMLHRRLSSLRPRRDRLVEDE